MEPAAISAPFKNRLLASLSAADIKRLRPHLVPVTLKVNRTLHDPGQLVDTAYFLEEGICSTVVTMENGSSVEVGITGRDGFVGLPAVLGTRHSLNRAFMQIPGHGFSIKAKALKEQCETSGGLLSSLQHFVQGMLMQTAQTAACNRVHELEERLARWLLMCQDRVQSDHIQITHEFLAMMLGTRRTSVTVTAGMLHKACLIEYSRGMVTILNRKGLMNSACECYQIIQEEYVRLGLL